MFSSQSLSVLEINVFRGGKLQLSIAKELLGMGQTILIEILCRGQPLRLD